MSWAQVAAKNSQEPQEQEKPQATAGNEWVDVDSSDRVRGGTDIRGEKRQRQMALLEQALKSPQDAVSGMPCVSNPHVGCIWVNGLFHLH